jgi:hypothetical protein
MELQEPLFGVEWNCRSLGFARDDKKERVVERERTVVKGQGGCWGGGDAPLPSTTALFIDITPLCEIKKVTASQDDDLCEF